MRLARVGLLLAFLGSALAVTKYGPVDNITDPTDSRLTTDAYVGSTCSNCSKSPSNSFAYVVDETASPVTITRDSQLDPLPLDCCNNYNWFCAATKPTSFTTSEPVCPADDTGDFPCTPSATVDRYVVCLGIYPDQTDPNAVAMEAADAKCTKTNKPTVSKTCPPASFDYVCAPTGTTEETLENFIDKSCADGNHFAPIDDTCYNEKKRAVFCYDSVYKTFGKAGECSGLAAVPDTLAVTTPVFSGCPAGDFAVRYADTAAPAFAETFTDAYEGASCTGCAMTPTHPVAVCFHTAFQIIAEGKCPSLAQPVVKPCAGCTPTWRCAATEEGLSTATTCADTDVKTGFDFDGTCSTDPADLTRAVGCYAADGTSTSSVDSSFCPPQQPTLSISKQCKYETLCESTVNSALVYNTCTYECTKCTTDHTITNGTPTCVKDDGNGNKTPVTEDEKFFCGAVAAPPPCIDECSYDFFCAPKSTSTTTYGSCDNFGGFDLPEGYTPDKCLDADLVPERTVSCFGYSEDAQGVRTIENSTPMPEKCSQVAADIPASTYPNMCEYSWRCQVLTEGGIVYDICTSKTGTCAPCSQGNLIITPECVNQDKGIDQNGSKCQGEPKPDITGDSCLNPSGCQFSWQCTAGDVTEGRACVKENFCAASADPALAVTATCVGVRGENPAAESDCVTFFGAKPETLSVDVCPAKWQCKNAVGAYVDCTVDGALNPAVATCPAPANAVEGCYQSTETATRECVDASGNATTDTKLCPVDYPTTTGGACTVNAGCQFSWKCKAGELTDARDCVKENFCSDTAELPVFDVACVGTFGENTATEADCANYIGVKPTTLTVGTCSAQWLCVDLDGGYADCNIGGKLNPALDTTCPQPNGALENCYNSTATATRACRDAADATVAAADIKCPVTFPNVEGGECVVDSACTFKTHCASTSDVDFVAAAECTDADDVGYGDCTVKCSDAMQHRFVKCVNFNLQREADDIKCGETLPKTERSCVTAPEFKDLAIAIQEGDSVAVDSKVAINWCYYDGGNPSTELVTVTLASNDSPKAFQSMRLGSFNLAAGSVEIEIPLLPPGESARIDLTTNAFPVTPLSAPLTLRSKCGVELQCGVNAEDCDDATSTCICKPGFTGPTCDITPCQVANCVEGRAECFNGGATPGKCECLHGFKGDRCEINDDCSDICENGGFKDTCEDTDIVPCTCVNNWTGDDCDTCEMSCSPPGTNAGKPDSKCSKCVCNRGYHGDSCQCRAAYGAISFPAATIALINSATWRTAFTRDIALVTGLPTADLSVEVVNNSTRTVVVTIRSCADLNSLVSRFRFRTLADMPSVYSAWEKVVNDIKSPTSVLKSGDAFSDAGSPTVAAMYDPACTGAGCPTGTDPFPTTPVEEDDDDKTKIIVGVVVGVGGALIVAAIIIGLYCTKSACFKPKEETYAISDKETDFTYNNRVSVYARPSIALTSVQAAQTNPNSRV